MKEILDLSIIIPCRNEGSNIGLLLSDIRKNFDDKSIRYEIIVVDNLSYDDSVEIAKKFNAHVVTETQLGYGVALRKGFQSASGRLIAFLDADYTYRAQDLIKIFTEIESTGLDLIYGNRIHSKMNTMAMPWLHRVIGTPFLTMIFNWRYGQSLNDINSGLRIFKKSLIDQMRFYENGMSFASELFVAFAQNGYQIRGIDIDYQKSPNYRKSHLKTFRDGFSHLKILLFN